MNSPAARNARPNARVRHSAVASGLAALATAATATTLTSVIQGYWWLVLVTVTVSAVACTGVALRALGARRIAVALAQLGVVALIATALFSEQAIATMFPGPASLSEMSSLLTMAGEEVRSSRPPVEPSVPIVALVTLATGLLGIVVDTIAVVARAPAAAGLALLCIYAIPASLSEEMLPWWSFVLGASAFAAIIAITGPHHRWRRFLHHSPMRNSPAQTASIPVALVSVAVACGLLAGSAITAIGTVGEFPGSGSSNEGRASTGMGIDPFTSLRGMLNHENDPELFRVRGLESGNHLMRAFTLDTFHPNEGWGLAEGDSLPGRLPATEPLPGPGRPAPENAREVSIEPINWRDVWLPVFGTPRSLDGIDDQWYFDALSGTVFSDERQDPPEYTVQSTLAEPDENELRAAEPAAGEPADVYTELDEVDSRVVALTEEITAGDGTTFDKAQSLWRFFTAGDRFTYDTATAAASDNDALTDFLLHGRRGYCEQFASAMAVMLRTQDIPARVAVGFTSGTTAVGYRSITAQDAHAWVEVYFGPEHGWVTFDPTPLDDGRSTIPPYLDSEDGADESTRADAATDPLDPGEELPQPPDTAGEHPVETPGSPESGATESVATAAAPDWARWPATVAVLLAALLTATTLAVTRRTASLRHAADARTVAVWISRANRYLPGVTSTCWLFGLALLGGQLAWWLGATILLTGTVVLAPWLLREHRRRSRLHSILVEPERAAQAAWHELLDECADRHIPVQDAETVRETGRKLVSAATLDTHTEQSVRSVIEQIESAWYGPARSLGSFLACAFESVRQGLHRASPLPLHRRLLPPSTRRLGTMRSATTPALRTVADSSP